MHASIRLHVYGLRTLCCAELTVAWHVTGHCARMQARTLQGTRCTHATL